MKTTNFTFKGEEDDKIYVYKYEPLEKRRINGIVQISHGMAEEASRYKEFANFLTSNGYVVYINDHRGHGKSAKGIENVGILAKRDGIHLIVKDLNKLTSIIKKEHKDIPIFLFSHSMGSFAAQKYIIDYSEDIDGVILSGTNGSHGFEVDLGFLLSKIIIKIKGRDKKGYFIDKIVFGGFNKKFKPNKTKFDWLNRDYNEIQKYIDNKYCGITFSNGYFYDLFKLLKEIRNLKNIEKIDKKLPVYIFAGDKDPAGKFGKGILKLHKNYKKVGIENVKYKLYKDGRHEMLNEINKVEVMNDVLKWIKDNNRLQN